ncbi:MAG: hypothetical protein WCO84_04415 [bacterium]
MILAPHIIIGVAVARTLPDNLILAFSAAFLSHFIADAVPHWEYDLSKAIDPKYSEKIRINKEFLWDFFRLSLDGLIGLFISFLLFYNGNTGFIIAGCLGGIFPDILQFLYGKFKNRPLIVFKKFHDSVHSEKKERKFLVGVLSPVFFTTIIVIFSYIFK